MEAITEHLVELRNLMSEQTLFAVGILLVAGYFMGKGVSVLRLPAITGFIIAGLLLGDSCLGVIHTEMGESLQFVTDLALGLIALTIGCEFYWAKLRRMGVQVLIITLFQLVATYAFVFAGLLFFGLDTPFAMMLASIATATAPAATVAIVQSLRAHGKFVDYLYGIVALDDAGCVIIFGISFSFATSMLGLGGAESGLGHAVAHALTEIGLSVLIGVAGGAAVHLVTRRMKNPNEVTIVTLGLVLILTAVAIAFKLSPILTNMAAGTVIINLSPSNHRLLKNLEPLTPPLYAMFFVIAGTELNPAILKDYGVVELGLVYIIARALGKYGGVYIGCLSCKAPKPITRNLGLCMLPQAGVALGLVLFINASPLMASLMENSPEYRTVINNMVNIVLFAVFINELVGPPVARVGIIKGNEMEE